MSINDPLSPDAVKQVFDVVPMNWRTEYKPIKDKPGEFKPVIWVDLVKKGSRGESVPHRLVDLQRNTQLWPHVEPYHAAWAKGQEPPVDGTPLEAWPGVTREQVEVLKHLHIRTVEDLAQTNEPALERIGMGSRRLRERAQTYLKSKEGGHAQIAAALGSRDEEIAELKRQLAEQAKDIAALTRDKPQRDRPGDVAKRA
jgi:hypothetical protein